MGITIHDTNCCCLKEIHGIASMPDGASIVEAVCVRYTKAHNGYGSGRLCKGYEFMSSRVPGLIFFTGVISHKDHSEIEGTSQIGDILAEFIRANKFGKVVDGATGYNRVNHPSHLVKIWTWETDAEALRVWYEASDAYKKAIKDWEQLYSATVVTTNIPKEIGYGSRIQINSDEALRSMYEKILRDLAGPSNALGYVRPGGGSGTGNSGY